MSIEQDDPTRVRPAELPHGLRVSAAWAWRILLIAGTIYLLWQIFSKYQVIFVPLLVALMLSALLKPVHRVLARSPGKPGLPNAAAALLTVFLTIVFVGGVIALIGQQAVSGFDSLRDDAADGIAELQQQLADSPLKVTNAQLDEYVDSIQESIRGNGGSEIVSGALEVTNTAGHVLTGLFITLFSIYFFLSSGDKMWDWVVGLFPAASREKVRGSGVRAWATLTAYVRATVIVAIVDGAGVGIGAAILGVPLAFPLGMVVFLGAFVPIVGALVSGAAAVLVALVSGGLVDALIMMLIVIAVQQLEAHILQPFLLGRAVRVHPLAVIIAIAAGVLLAGMVGALFAVPLVAVVNVIGEYLAGRDPDDQHEQPNEDGIGPLADETRDDDTPDPVRHDGVGHGRVKGDGVKGDGAGAEDRIDRNARDDAGDDLNGVPVERKGQGAEDLTSDAPGSRGQRPRA